MKLQSRLKQAVGLNPVAIKLATKCYSPTGISGNQTQYQKFVIASYQRSGSTMLTSALKNHSQAHCYGEIYNLAKPMLWTEGYENDNAWLHAIRDHRPSAFLENFIFRGYSPSIKAVGFKIFPEHAQAPRFQETFADLLADESVKFIHLTRKNKLAVHLSMIQARATGVWAVKDGPKRAQKSIRLDPYECEIAFSKLEAEDNYFREQLAGRNHILATYEQLVYEKSCYQKILHYLGINQEQMRPHTSKQRALRLDEAIENFDELRQHFTNTPWSSFFQPDS